MDKLWVFFLLFFFGIPLVGFVIEVVTLFPIQGGATVLLIAYVAIWFVFRIKRADRSDPRKSLGYFKRRERITAEHITAAQIKIKEIAKAEERAKAEEIAKAEERAKTERTRAEERAKADRLVQEKKLAIKVTLAEAEANQLAAVHAKGTGTYLFIELVLESKTKQPLTVCISRNSVFKGTEATCQNMIVTDDKEVHLSPFKTETILVQSACINMNRPTPSTDDILHPTQSDLPLYGSGHRAPPQLAKLIGSKAFDSSNVLLRQAAVWILTDNPTRADMKASLSRKYSVGRGPDGAGRRPEDVERLVEAEFEQLRALLNECRVPLEDLKVFE